MLNNLKRKTSGEVLFYAKETFVNHYLRMQNRIEEAIPRRYFPKVGVLLVNASSLHVGVAYNWHP